MKHAMSDCLLSEPPSDVPTASGGRVARPIASIRERDRTKSWIRLLTAAAPRFSLRSFRFETPLGAKPTRCHPVRNPGTRGFGVPPLGFPSKWWCLALSVCPVVCLAQGGGIHSGLGDPAGLVEKYEKLLLPQPEDYQASAAARAAVEGSLRTLFRRAVRNVRNFEYDWPGEPVYFSRRVDTGTPLTSKQQEIARSDAGFRRLVLDLLPKLAYAYLVQGPADMPNPHYQSAEILQLYIAGLEHAYSRGVTEQAWLPDHAGTASADAMKSGLARPAGDVSELSLRLGGFVQSIFLMREPLAAAGLLDKYRAVIRNLALNNGTMYPAFFQFAREEAAIRYATPLSEDEAYHLNADGMRLFVDTFWPYFLLIEDAAERSRMSTVLSRVMAANLAVKPGVQGVIKPDGTGFHHATAYVGAYTPGAFEAAAQLLYLAKQTTYYKSENVEALKSALETYRIMVQKYSVSASLRRRLIGGSGLGTTDQVAKALVFLSHRDGMGDFDMRGRFREFFDAEQFFADDRAKAFYEGSRGIAIRGLGIYRLVADLLGPDFPAAEQPTGVWIKPYATAGFFRQGDWLVTAKAFSQYFWDYEGTENENSFGQNWAYGLLQVFSAGTPVSETGSGHDLFNGWDWYHVPGTTASHYPIQQWEEGALKSLRTSAGIVQRDVHRNYNTKTFAGGVTLRNHGFFVQDLEAVPFAAPTDLRARKTYFFVGDRVLALGTRISGGTKEHETHTTLFQTRLESAEDPTWLNGERLVGLDIAREVAAAPAVSMIDSVGNSYFLASSTASLMVTRSLQASMTDDQEPSEGEFAQAYLNHGIKPTGDSYAYVLIPADSDGTKLRALAAAPSAYYRVIESDSMHLLRFPEHGVTAYAFYELVDTPAGELVRRVDQHAAVITERTGDEVRLAASVPDIGWQFEEVIQTRGLNYASRHFKRQVAKVHSLKLDLRGSWAIRQGPESATSEIVGDDTIVRMQASDGMSVEILLTPVHVSVQE